MLAVEYLRKGNESTAFNLGSSTGFSNLQIVEAARKVTGHPIPTWDCWSQTREIQIPWSHHLRRRVQFSAGNQNLIISKPSSKQPGHGIPATQMATMIDKEGLRNIFFETFLITSKTTVDLATWLISDVSHFLNHHKIVRDSKWIKPQNC